MAFDEISYSKAKKVEKRLDQAIESGQNLDGWIEETSKLGQRIDQNQQQVTSQLAQTTNEAMRKRELEDLSSTVLAAIEGGEGTSFKLLSIPQNHSVTVDKTNFADRTFFGDNLLPNYEIIEGGYYDADGSWVPSTAFFTIEDYIPVITGYEYYVNAYNVRKYDENYNIIGSFPNNETIIKIDDSTTRFIRPNYRNTITPSIEDGYIYEVGMEIKKLKVSPRNLDNELKEKIKRIGSLTDITSKELALNPFTTEKFMHFSCDDFVTPLQDLYNNQATYTSIFDNQAFAFLKTTHDKYGITYSAYCFYENADASFNLTMVPNKFKKDFIDNSHWLKFGFHSINPSTTLANTATEAREQYSQVIDEIVRFTGSYKCIDRMPRLHNYAGNLESVLAIKNTMCGIVGLLTAEDSRTNYYHNPEQTNHLLGNDRLYDDENNLFFFSTDIRLDSDGTPKDTLDTRKNNVEYQNRMQDLVLFQHDPNVSNINHQLRIIASCEFALENGYRFDFPMNVVMG